MARRSIELIGSKNRRMDSAKSLLALYFFLAILTGCAPVDVNAGGVELSSLADYEGKIVNGREDWGRPAVGALKFRHGSSEKYEICSGTLIKKHWVLTAKHCLFKDGEKSRDMKFVIHDSRGSAKQRIDVVDMSYHDEVDIGVVKLAHDAMVAPEKINFTRLQKGTDFVLMGYGRTASNRNDGGTKRIASHNHMQVLTSTFRYDQTGSRSGNCYGDSGGPSFIRVDGAYVVAGVHSAIIFGNGACGREGVDIRVDKYVDWISQEVGGLESNECPGNQKKLIIGLHTDRYGYETNLKVIRNRSGEVLLNSPGKNDFGRDLNYANHTPYIGKVCLPPGRYTFKVSDERGDGICCTYGEGGVELKLDRRFIASIGRYNRGDLTSGDFGKEWSKEFTVE